jgi:hypothetical protein
VTIISAAERMKAMRARRRREGLREIRMVLPDIRMETVRARIARQIDALPDDAEREAMAWIEAVSEFDEAG